MAFAVTNLTTAAQSAVSSLSTASISPSANALVLLSVAASAGGAGTPIVSGGGISNWVLVKTQNDVAGGRAVWVFRGMSASPGSGAANVNVGTTANINISVDQITGVDQSGTDGSGAVVQSGGTTNNGTNTGLSVTLAALASPANGTFGVFRQTGNNTETPGSGYSSVSTNFSSVGSMLVEFKAVGSTTVDASWSSSANNPMAVALEIKIQPTYTLTAAAGSYAYAGVSAFRKIARLAAKGTYTYTGVAAFRSFKRLAAAGAYVLTGIAALKKMSFVQAALYRARGTDPALDRTRDGPDGLQKNRVDAPTLDSTR